MSDELEVERHEHMGDHEIAARAIETARRLRLAFATAHPEAELFVSLPAALASLTFDQVGEVDPQWPAKLFSQSLDRYFKRPFPSGE